MNRRSFLKSAAIAQAGIGMGHLAAFGSTGGKQGIEGHEVPESAFRPSDMPTVELGGCRISRLISGSNPVNGGSHMSKMLNRSMKEYFTDENTVKYFQRCTEHGINLFQGSSARNFEIWNRSCPPGETRHFISLVREDENSSGISIDYAVKNKFLGLAYHGEFTDALFKKGRLDKIHDFLKKIRGSGLLVGVSTHMPDVIDYIESRDWDVDFYMNCVYERHRSADVLKEMLGYVPLPVREVYLEEDPPRMYKAIRQTEKTCLAFKILAAGRVCDRDHLLEKAFKDAFDGIKSGDAVIVGMFPKWTDHVRINSELVAKYGG